MLLIQNEENKKFMERKFDDFSRDIQEILIKQEERLAMLERRDQENERKIMKLFKDQQ